MTHGYPGKGDMPMNPPAPGSAVRRSTDYTTPADRMAEAAALLISQPNAMCHALIAALDAIKGRGCRNVIINKLNEEASQ